MDAAGGSCLVCPPLPQGERGPDKEDQIVREMYPWFADLDPEDWEDADLPTIKEQAPRPGSVKPWAGMIPKWTFTTTSIRDGLRHQPTGPHDKRLNDPPEHAS